MANRSQTRGDEDGSTPISVFVPGTEILYDLGNSEQIHHLQHVKHGDGHILLVPQPSLTDANDPLRWTKWKKWVVLFNAVWYSFNGGVTGPIMAAGMFCAIALQMHISDLYRHDWAHQDV
jgi:hypothetical protein